MRKLGVALLAIALLLGLGGIAAVFTVDAEDGSGSRAPSTDVPTSTPHAGATEPPVPGLRRYYAQELTWTTCRRIRLCATLTVPLDYRRPRGRTIHLALLKVPAEDPARRIGSLVVNPGGPGVPGTDYAEQAQSVFREPLRTVYDVVGFDPRGTGDSEPVDCLTDADLDRYVAADPDPDTPAEVADYADWLDRLGRGCVRRSGDLAAHVSTVETARDLDVLRATLGESELTYFGASYGTELGAIYADLFPDKVGRMVLDGAVDLSIDARQLDLQQAAGFETALRAYVAACVDQADGCFLGTSVEAGLQRIRGFFDDVDAQPLPGFGGRELRIGNAFYGVAAPLYDNDYWPILSQALFRAFDDDGSLLLRLSDAYNARGSDGYLDNRDEANYAIGCLDDPTSIPPSAVPEAVPEFERASPTFGRVFAWGLTACSGIRVHGIRAPRHVTAPGAPPIVVVGTTRDPATPMRWAEALAAELRSGVLVRRDGDGHTGYNSGNECVDEAVEAYLVRGSVPRDGLSC